jgi:hypothetical protein
MEPLRFLDTRCGPAIGAGKFITVKVAGTNKIPRSAKGVIMTVTVARPGADGYLLAFPSGTRAPRGVLLTYKRQTNSPQILFGKLGAADGALNFLVSTQAHVVVDVTGYLTETSGLYFGVMQPYRVN